MEMYLVKYTVSNLMILNLTKYTNFSKNNKIMSKYNSNYTYLIPLIIIFDFKSVSSENSATRLSLSFFSLANKSFYAYSYSSSAFI